LPDELKFEVVERTRKALEGTGELNTLDGVRVTYPDGAWSLVSCVQHGSADRAALRGAERRAARRRPPRGRGVVHRARSEAEAERCPKRRSREPSRPPKPEPWSIQRVLRWRRRTSASAAIRALGSTPSYCSPIALGTDRIRLVIESERYLA
jgi:hypothetical protein